MDRFVVRGISANDAAKNLQRQVDQHDEMLHRRALDREDAATAKRGPGRPRKLSSIGLLLARDPAASPSTPPPPSRTGRSHANWWHPASIRPILQAVPACSLQDSVQQITSQLDAGTAAEDTKLDLSGRYLKPLSLVWAVSAHQHINRMSDLVLSGYKNAGTLRAFEDSYQRAAMTEMGRLFEVPLLDPVLKVPQLLQVSAAGVAGRTESAAGVFALAKAAAWVTARARKFECSEENAEICRHCKQPQEHHDFMGEVQCPN
ncbi:hypothetical protein QJQ45_012722 [Haematococcus lacustris]|nr:hypothetical protein QJQ45_012722 [Haematococcus lacustris]